MFRKAELNGPKGRLDKECGMRGEEEKAPKNDPEVSGLKAWDQNLKGCNSQKLRKRKGPAKETETEQLEAQAEYQGRGVTHVKRKAYLKNKKMIDEVKCN